MEPCASKLHMAAVASSHHTSHQCPQSDELSPLNSEAQAQPAAAATAATPKASPYATNISCKRACAHMQHASSRAPTANCRPAGHLSWRLSHPVPAGRRAIWMHAGVHAGVHMLSPHGWLHCTSRGASLNLTSGSYYRASRGPGTRMALGTDIPHCGLPPASIRAGTYWPLKGTHSKVLPSVHTQPLQPLSAASSSR
jgi:hypothetical protein